MKKPKPKKEKLDPFHYHEVMDRACMVLDIFTTHVAEHPVAKQNPLLFMACQKAEEALAEVYSCAGRMQILAEGKAKVRAVVRGMLGKK